MWWRPTTSPPSRLTTSTTESSPVAPPASGSSTRARGSPPGLGWSLSSLLWTVVSSQVDLRRQLLHKPSATVSQLRIQSEIHRSPGRHALWHHQLLHGGAGDGHLDYEHDDLDSDMHIDTINFLIGERTSTKLKKYSLTNLIFSSPVSKNILTTTCPPWQKTTGLGRQSLPAVRHGQYIRWSSLVLSSLMMAKWRI